MWLILHGEVFYSYRTIIGNYYSIICNALSHCLLNSVRNGHPYTGFNSKY